MIKPKSIGDMFKYKGSRIELDDYTSIWNRIRRIKATGGYIPSPREDDLDNIKFLEWSFFDDYSGKRYHLMTPKEGYSVDECIEDLLGNEKGRRRRLLAKMYRRQMMPLEKITFYEQD